MDDPMLLVAGAVVAGAIVAHVFAVRARAWREVALLAVVDVVAVGLAMVAFSDPTRFSAWMQEDAWAEWATCFYFLAAAAICAVIALRCARPTAFFDRRSHRWLAVTGALGLSAFALFVAGEEISWAQRLLAFEPPELFLEHNFQQELNIHNMLKGEELAGMSLDSRWLVVLIALGYGVAFPLAAVALRRVARPLPSILVPHLSMMPRFGAVAVAEIAYPIELTGEAAELLLGLCFFVDAWMRAARHLPAAVSVGRTRRRLAIALAAPMLLALVTPTAVEVLIYGAPAETTAQTVDELETLAGDVLSQARAGETRFRSRRRVHKRMFTAVRSGYIRFGASSEFLGGLASPAEADGEAARRDRRGYFLDPWNNPYWVLYVRGTDRVILYSFGPNRRRDTNVRDNPMVVGGDDIIVGVALTAAGAPTSADMAALAR